MRGPAIIGAFLLVLTSAARAQFPSWYLPHNQVQPTVTSAVSLDPATGDFLYVYTVANGAGAQQRLAELYMDLKTQISSATAPTDWEVLADPAGGTVVWGASGPVDLAWTELHPLDPPSHASEIAPGATRTGFSLRSPCAGTGPVTFFARGYNHEAQPPQTDANADSAPAVPQWRTDAVSGQTLGPGDCSTVRDWGNRRPGVDGFLGVVNFASGDALPGGVPVTVQVRFSRSSEAVLPATFHAVLNSQDVTAQFVTNSRGDRVAVFPPGAAPLKSGRNVLLLSVDGIVPGTTHQATDSDRFLFTLP